MSGSPTGSATGTSRGSNPTNCWPGIWSWPTATAANSARVTQITAELALQSARCYLSAARCARTATPGVREYQAARGVALAAADPALRAELRVGRLRGLPVQPVTLRRALQLVEELDRIADAALALHGRRATDASIIVYTDPSRLPEVDERLRGVPSTNSPSGRFGQVRRRPTGASRTRGRLGRIGEAEADLFEALIAASPVR